ncbi:MAG: outer membrane beta-barrel protein [Pseudomonadota bacterium]
MKRAGITSAITTGLMVGTLFAPMGHASEPTPLPPSVNWGGFYAGVHGGISNGEFDGIFDEAGTEPFTTFQSFNTQDVHAGLQAGAAIDVRGLVFGIEADITWGGANGAFVDGEDDTQRVRIDQLSSVRGKFGAAADKMFVYLTGGIAFTETTLVVENGEDRLTLADTGFVYGAGVEYMLAPGVSIKGEVLRFKFDEYIRSTDIVDNGNSAIDDLNDGDDDDFFAFDGLNVARIGVNIRPGAFRHGGFGGYQTNSAADFSGIYVGGTIGYGDTTVSGVFDTAGGQGAPEFRFFDMKSVNGSVAAGMNVQKGAMLLGVEADYMWNGSGDAVIDGENDLQELDADWLATARARLGVVNDRMLVYATAGFALGELDLIVENGTDSLTLSGVGIAYGGGVEYQFTPAVSLKAEYLRITFDEGSAGDESEIENLNDGDEDDSISFTGHDIVRVGVNVRLNGLLGR